MPTTANNEPRVPKPKPHVESSQTDGRGYKLWKTRRANQFIDAVAWLKKAQTADIDRVLMAAHEISLQIAELVPPHVTELPRGYRVVERYQERFIERDGVLFASFGRSLAGREDLEKFALDLNTGWVREIQEMLRFEHSGEASNAR